MSSVEDCNNLGGSEVTGPAGLGGGLKPWGLNQGGGSGARGVWNQRSEVRGIENIGVGV